MKIEKWDDVHGNTTPDDRKGALGAPRGPDITSVNEAAGAGHRAACPLAPLPFIR